MAEIIFLGLAVVLLGSAFLSVWLKNVYYNALALILCLGSVAGMFIYLQAEFLAVIEVIVYVGAISVAIIFVIMLSQPMLRQYEKRSAGKVLRSGVIALLLFVVLYQTLSGTQWPAAPLDGDYSVGAIGLSLLSDQILAFEAISLVLLVAIIGALLISDKKRAR